MVYCHTQTYYRRLSEGGSRRKHKGKYWHNGRNDILSTDRSGAPFGSSELVRRVINHNFIWQEPKCLISIINTLVSSLDPDQKCTRLEVLAHCYLLRHQSQNCAWLHPSMRLMRSVAAKFRAKIYGNVDNLCEALQGKNATLQELKSKQDSGQLF